MDLLKQQFNEVVLVMLVVLFASLAMISYHYNQTAMADWATGTVKLVLGGLLFSMRAGNPSDRQQPPVVNLHFPVGTVIPLKDPVRADTPVQGTITVDTH